MGLPALRCRDRLGGLREAYCAGPVVLTIGSRPPPAPVAVDASLGGRSPVQRRATDSRDRIGDPAEAPPEIDARRGGDEDEEAKRGGDELQGDEHRGEDTGVEVVDPFASCGDEAHAAVRTALAAAELGGASPEHLADCRPEALSSVKEQGPVEAGDRCKIVVYPESTRWEVVIVPRPMTGALTKMQVWVDETGTEAGRVQIHGSTWGVVDGVQIEGHGEYASHTHGGEAARIGGARFEVDNHRDTPVELVLVGARWLKANSCELPREERSRPKVAGLAIGDGLINGVRTVTIPAGTHRTVRIGHVVQRAYMASCDRFATAALFEVDGVPVEVIGEHRVVRRTPLRR